MDFPPVVKFFDGYQNGVQCANEDVFVLQDYTQDFMNPDLGATVAAEMIGKGTDVIFGTAGPTGIGAIAADPVSFIA